MYEKGIEDVSTKNRPYIDLKLTLQTFPVHNESVGNNQEVDRTMGTLAEVLKEGSRYVADV